MKLVFFARILPERFALSAPELRYQVTIPAFGFSYDCHLATHAGQVVAQIESDDSFPDIDTTKNIVEGNIRSIVDYFGFIHGVRFDVDMVSVVDDSRNWKVFGIDIPAIKSAVQGKVDQILKKYFHVAVRDPESAIVMADFREAMRNPTNTGFYCFRAIEAMMQTMRLKETANDSDSWERFRNNLKIDRACLDAIKAHADPPRHGKPHAMTDSERAYIFTKTHEIIIRYLEFCFCGRQELDVSTFPILQA